MQQKLCLGTLTKPEVCEHRSFYLGRNRAHPIFLKTNMNKSTMLLASLMLTLLGACGQKDVGAPAAMPAVSQLPSLVPVAAPVTGDTLGKSVFGKTCGLCHGAGVGGAPRPGDKAEWSPRISQGNEVLYKHALEGFSGAKGYMPPRGGYPKLSDEEVKAAVGVMVDQSR